MEVLNGVPREEADVELEKGEVVLSTEPSTNQKVTASVGGKKHSNGGTPEKLPAGTAVYSDHLKLKDPTLLKVLGFNGKKPKTFADIAKKWDTAELIKKSEDPTNDKIAATSIEKSIDDANFKLSLTFAIQQFHEKKDGSQQEHSKHFEPLLERTGMTYEQLLGTAEGQEKTDTSPEQPVMNNGGQVSFDSIPTYQNGDETDAAPTAYEQASDAFKITPTGKLNYYSAREEDLDVYTNTWKSLLDVDKFTTNEDFQAKEYDWALKNNPESIKNMWLTYGLTAKGMGNSKLRALSNNGRFTRDQLNDPEVLKELKDAFVDGYFGIRQLDPNAPELTDKTVIKRIDPTLKKMDELHQWNPKHIQNNEEPEDLRFRWENRRALAQAQKNRATIPYLKPLTAVSDTFYTDQAYYNPDQAIAAIQSESQAQNQARGMFAAPQQQLANQMAGKAFQTLAGVIGNYADKNVNAYNRERLVNTKIAQRASNQLASQVESHHGKVATLKQAFSNAYRTADNQVAEQEIAMHQERAQRRNLEKSIGEQYRIDPNTGLRVFVKGKDFFPNTTPDATVDDRFADIKRKHPGISDDAAVKLAMAEFSGKYNVQSTSNQPYNPNNYTS